MVEAQQALPASVYLGAVDESIVWRSCSFTVTETYAGVQRVRQYNTTPSNVVVVITDINPYATVVVTAVPPSGWTFNRWIDENRSTLGYSSSLNVPVSPGGTTAVYAVIQQQAVGGIDLNSIMSLMVVVVMMGMMMKVMK